MAKVKQDDGTSSVNLSKIRAAIAQVKISVEDIRTSKEDPNSTKRFCTGTLKLRFPPDVLSEATRARDAAKFSSIEDLADQSQVERNANVFSTQLEFNIQPTDDGTKIFAEIESGNNIFDFGSEVITSGLLRAIVEEVTRANLQAAQAQAAAENSALAEQRGANLNAAKTENQLAQQTITAVWKSIPTDTRSRLLALQRAWIRKKIADCNVEAASFSLDSGEREIARLSCDTRSTQERINWLSQFRNYGTYDPNASATDDAATAAREAAESM